MSLRTASPPITASRSTFEVPLSCLRASEPPAPFSERLHPRKSARRRSFAPTRSVRACAGSGEPSASRPPPSSAGSKKESELELEDTLLQAPANAVLELDELWSFCHPKSEKVWVWLALCRKTRQVVVAFVSGERSRASCERLWRVVPESYYKGSICYSDLWDAYQKEVIPKESGTRLLARKKARPATSRGGSTL